MNPALIAQLFVAQWGRDFCLFKKYKFPNRSLRKNYEYEKILREMSK